MPSLNPLAVAELKRTTARGALTSMGAQAATLLVRTASLVVLARLLLKEDFGLVNMVTAFTGVLGLMYAGLSMASVQQPSLTRAQASALFWLNLAIGIALALLATAAAPLLAAFYAEPRLFWMTVVLGMNFVFSGASVQHRALLQRNMQFSVLATIDMLAIVGSAAAAISLALAGFGYWALVAMVIVQPVVMVVGVWLATRWVPGMPERRAGIRSMVMYGGAVTLNNFIVYVAYNADKVLIGRVWGAEALGIYGRAYQLINLPIENLNSTIGMVAFPALARIQDDSVRLARYFLGGYSLFLAAVIPTTIECALFADDVVMVLLGARWLETATIFRLLTPTILAFAVANPFIWLMLAGGRAGRSLQISLVMTPVLIVGYALGLVHGPEGVAAAFSTIMVVATVPVVLWAKRGTSLTVRDIVRAISPAAVSIALGALVVLAARPVLQELHVLLVRLIVESAVLLSTYLFTLLFVMKQKPLYIGLLRETGLWPGDRRRTAAATALAPVGERR
jgi:PST family polysaccharide transporter